MRSRLALLLAAACAGAAPAQQFGQDRTTPAPPPTTTPAAPAAPTAPTPAPQPAAPVQQASYLTPAAVAPAAKPPAAPHPWAVTPAHGAWFVSVKSYTGPTARQDAEALATFVRTTYNAAAFLYEWGGDERERQEKLRAEIMERKAREMAPFIQAQADLRRAAVQKGDEFIPTRVTVQVPKITFETQWAVLVGGWPTMEAAADARKKVIKNWDKLPSAKLLDRIVVADPEAGKKGAQGQYVNPFGTSSVVPNPAVKRAQDQERPLDQVVIDMNKDEPLSVLKIKKAWTLTVKDFPMQATTHMNQQEGSVLGKVFGVSDKYREFDRMGETAVEFAKALRSPQMQQSANEAAARLGMPPVVLDAYVLHVQTGSRVTVGQFDSLEDPQLAATQRLLAHMTFVAKDPATGQPVVDKKSGQSHHRLFDGITPMPVPRVK